MEVRYFFRAVLDSGVLRVWTGVGEYTLAEPFAPDGGTGADGVYTDGAALLGVVDSTMRFGMRGRSLTATPVVGRVVDVFVAGRIEKDKWKLLPFVRRGLLNNPILEGGEYSVEVAPRTYIAPATQWSHEEHERDHEGDTYFSQLRALAKGINGIHFPQVPNFNCDGEYPRAIQQPIGRPGGRGSPDSGLTATPKTSTAGVVGIPGSASRRALTGAAARIRPGF